MSEPAELGVVIPVYNEGDAILTTYEYLRASLDGKLRWKAYVIYDFAEDSTVPFINKIAQSEPRVIPVQQTYGRGVANALKFGFDYVQEPAIAVVMGDNSDDLATLPRMYQEFLHGASVVASSRHSQDGSYQGGSFVKRILSKIAGKVLYFAGIGTQDPTNNFKLYSKEFVNDIEIQSSGGFEVALELTVKAAVSGRKIAEVPGSWRDRTQGQSKFKLIKWLPFYLRWFFYALFSQWLPTIDSNIAPLKKKAGAKRATHPLWMKLVPLGIASLLIAWIWFRVSNIWIWDEWDSLAGFLSAVHSHGLQWLDLWSPDNQHRMVIPKLIFYLASLITYSPRLLMTFSVLIYFAIYNLYVETLATDLKGPGSNLWLAIVAFYFFILVQDQNFFWGFQVAWPLTILGMATAIFATLNRRAWLALAGFFLAYFSMGAWIAAVPILILIPLSGWCQSLDDNRRKTWKIWFVSSVLIQAIAFFIYTRGLVPKSDMLHLLTLPGLASYAGYFLVMLGSPFQLMGANVAFLMGCAFLFSFLYFWQRKQFRDQPIVFYLAALSILCSLLVSLGRSPGWAWSDEVRGRYCSLVVLGWCAYLILIYPHVIKYRRGLAIAIVALVLNLVISWDKAVDHEIWLEGAQTNQARCLVSAIKAHATTIPGKNCTDLLYPDPERLLQIATHLYADGIFPGLRVKN